MTTSSDHNQLAEAKNLYQRLSESDKQYQKNKQHDQQQEAQAEILADKLWPMLGDMYGHKLVSQYGETPPDAWVKCLKGISGQQIADGLNACIATYAEWPPTAPAFRNLCLGIPMDQDGKEIAHRAGIYSTEPTERMKEKKKFMLESDRAKQKRKQVGIDALDNLKGMFE